MSRLNDLDASKLNKKGLVSTNVTIGISASKTLEDCMRKAILLEIENQVRPDRMLNKRR